MEVIQQQTNNTVHYEQLRPKTIQFCGSLTNATA